METERLNLVEPEQSGHRPLVTILLSCFNHERFLSQALDSIAAQSYPSIHLLVTDDASQDGSAAMIEEFLKDHCGSSQFVRNSKNRGFTTTLNAVKRLLHGDYLNIMSADDWMEPTHIERKVAVLEALGPQYGMCYGDAYRADQEGSGLAKRFSNRALVCSQSRPVSSFLTSCAATLFRRIAYSCAVRYLSMRVIMMSHLWRKITTCFSGLHVPQWSHTCQILWLHIVQSMAHYFGPLG